MNEEPPVVAVLGMKGESEEATLSAGKYPLSDVEKGGTQQRLILEDANTAGCSAT
jgi:hypothetical protein